MGVKYVSIPNRSTLAKTGGKCKSAGGSKMARNGAPGAEGRISVINRRHGLRNFPFRSCEISSRDTPVVGRQYHPVRVGRVYNVCEGIIPTLRRSEFIGFEGMGI
jgi:hypothetical protein